MTTTATVLPDRLAALVAITLDSGKHTGPDDGMCSMEWVAWAAGLGFTDHPECASPVIGTFVRSLNDTWDTPTRQRLKPYLPRMVGTGGDGQDEARSYLALDWLVRTYTPAWLDLAGLTIEAARLRSLRRIVDQDTAEQAGPVVREAQGKAAAAGDAAGDAAGAAAGDAAGNAAWEAAWDTAGDAAGTAVFVAGAAAGDAARDAARTAAGVAAWEAAWDTAGDAAGTAVFVAGAAAWAPAWDAAWDTLRPTVETLQASALDLLDRMIVGTWDDEAAA